MHSLRVTRAAMVACLVVALAGCGRGGEAPSTTDSANVTVTAIQSHWQESRFTSGCDPGPFSDPPPVDDNTLDVSTFSSIPDLAQSMHLSVHLSTDSGRAPLLGTGFNFEHGLWSCPAFQPVLQKDLLAAFHPSLARIDTGLLPAAPPQVPAFLLGRNVYQSVLTSQPYAGQWQMLPTLERAGARIVLGVWGGPEQFTDDGTRRGVLLPSHYDDYVEYVVSIIDFLVGQQKLPVWAITIANEPDGGDGNQIPPEGLAYIAHQLAIRLAPFGVRLYGPDTSSADAAMDYLPSLLADPVVADHLAFVGFHQYSGDPSVAVVSDYVHSRRPGLPVVVTEYTSFGFGDLDAGQEGSDPLGFTLDIADTLLAHYRLGADAALYWDAVDYLQPGHDAITRWGLLRSPAEDFAPRERYYGLLQVLPYLQPGAEVLRSERQGGDDVGLLAIRTADGQIALFFVNEQDSPVDVFLQLTGVAPETLSVTRTDYFAAASAAGTVRLDDGTGQVELPARSLTTLSSP